MNLFAHLSFSTLRPYQALDHRKLADGKPLRQSFEVPYMRSLRTETSSPEGSQGWIHETQISIEISIIDQSCWSAYVFEDTYYKKGTEAERLNESLQGSRVFSPDALAGTAGDCGEVDSALFEDPLVYFLTLLEARITQFHLELDRIVEVLEKNVKW